MNATEMAHQLGVDPYRFRRFLRARHGGAGNGKAWDLRKEDPMRLSDEFREWDEERRANWEVIRPKEPS